MNLNRFVDKDFSGVISICRPGECLLEQGYGYADIPNLVPNQVDTRFATASAGKVFVAVGILKLIEEGLLRFDSTIGNILTLDLGHIDKKVTVSQLLSHTSGVPDYFDETTMSEYSDLWLDVPNYRIRKSLDLLPLFKNKPMMYSPGEKFQYNNTGFVLLGMMIEEITKDSFDKYLKRAVFDPCEMHDTGYFELDRLPSRCANSYIYDSVRNEYYINIYSVDAKGSGAGGAFTTIPDIRNFWKSLLSFKLVSQISVEEMLSLKSHHDSEYYGYGIWLDKTNSYNYNPFFQGSDPGVSFISYHDQELDLQLTIVSNKGDNVWKMANEIVSEFRNLTSSST